MEFIGDIQRLSRRTLRYNNSFVSVSAVLGDLAASSRGEPGRVPFAVRTRDPASEPVVARRTKLIECLSFLRQGDVLTVTKPDRLARSTAELLAIEADLSKRGIGLMVLSMGEERLDTRNSTSKLMLTILAGVATWEREVMLERQREGIAKAKAEGKYKERKPTVGLQIDVIRQMRADGLGPAKIARQLGVARSSVYRVLETPMS
jgi:DNA invertase Pin-like site-specific DNA recombinase